MRAVLRAFVLLVVVLAIAGGLATYSVLGRGLSTRVAPSPVETYIARAMRGLATPSAARNRPNPIEATPEVMEEALAHFADHCASCHANDGSGATELGRNLYPPAPDMRADATQSLTDGELFSLIENGVRLTGMPAWGHGHARGGATELGSGALHPPPAVAHARGHRADGGAEPTQPAAGEGRRRDQAVPCRGRVPCVGHRDAPGPAQGAALRSEKWEARVEEG